MWSKKLSGINKQASPAMPLPKAERRAVAGDKKREEATPAGPRRHRMAGSTTSGEYITEHHRGRKG